MARKQEQQQTKVDEDYLYGAMQPTFGEVRIRNRGRLPHWEKEAKLYFVTFHLGDSLPCHVVKKIIERQHLLSSAMRLAILKRQA